MKIYVASSWRCERQPDVVAALRAAGHEVYDFKNPAPGDHGFGWKQVTPEPPPWSAEKTIEVLAHPVAERGFDFDMNALKWCDACVMVQPYGRSAVLELGWACGAGKLTVALLADDQEPELMLKMVDKIAASIEETILFFAENHPAFGPNEKRYKVASQPHKDADTAAIALTKFFAEVNRLREKLHIPEVLIVAGAYHSDSGDERPGLECQAAAFGDSRLSPELGAVAYRLYTAPVLDRARKLESLTKEEASL